MNLIKYSFRIVLLAGLALITGCASLQSASSQETPLERQASQVNLLTSREDSLADNAYALMVDGGDPQLDAAIEHLLAEIERNGHVRPQRPAGPDRTGWGTPMDDR